MFLAEDPDGLNSVDRAFAVDTTPQPSDITAPTTALVSPPSGAITDPTPTLTFHSTEDSTYQCSLDSGAFLPCGSATVGTANTTYTIPDALAYPTDDAPHTFAVRAQDTAGNVDLTPDSASFTVVAPSFAPSFTASVSDTQARAHPDLTLTIDNPSNQNIKGLTFALPDGFLGSLSGVQALCPVADANAGACSAVSKAGTVDADATIDESHAHITGNVYLTEPFQTGDPAGMVITIDPSIQDIHVNTINVRARLSVRGQVQGIDTATFDDIPQSATTNYNETINFKAHKFVLHLGDQPGAPDHLLVNPSNCASSNFKATFTGYSTGTAAPVQEFHATGCDTLPFSSSLSAVVTKDGTSTAPVLGDLVRLNATVSSAPGDSAIKNATVVLPKPMTIDVLKLTTPCEHAEYNDGAGTCPDSTKIGTVSATSPLLPEALTGDVYMLRAVAPKVLPRLLLRLHGRISIDLIGANSFVNGSQIQSDFTDLPDVPLNSFSLSIGTLLSVGYDPCKYKGPYAATGSLTSQNGATVALNSPLDIRCNGFEYKYKAMLKGKKTTLKFSARAANTNKLKKVTLKLPKGITLLPKALKKKLIVKGDGKKLKAKCFKAKGKNTLIINLCGKQFSQVDVNFKPGSLNAKKGLKKPKLTVTTVDAANKQGSSSLALTSTAFKSYKLP